MSQKEEFKRVVRESTNTIVDTSTGEIKTISSTKENIVDREPDYIKLYIDNIIKLNDLPNATNGILNNILKNMSYENEIVLVAHVKNRIANEMGIKVNTIDQNLRRLVSKGILTRVGRGVYKANPFLFGRGKWKDIKELRMSIKYNKDGQFILTEVDKQGELNFNDEL